MKETLPAIKAIQVIDQDKVDEIQRSLEIIDQKIDLEIHSKQNTIERQENTIEGQQQEIQRLHDLIEQKNETLAEHQLKLSECQRNNEGSRQLINKLLGDLDRLAQDIEWYKRTYEKRSLIGTIRQKMFNK